MQRGKAFEYMEDHFGLPSTKIDYKYRHDSYATSTFTKLCYLTMPASCDCDSRASIILSTHLHIDQHTIEPCCLKIELLSQH